MVDYTEEEIEEINRMIDEDERKIKDCDDLDEEGISDEQAMKNRKRWGEILKEKYKGNNLHHIIIPNGQIEVHVDSEDDPDNYDECMEEFLREVAPDYEERTEKRMKKHLGEEDECQQK